MELKQRLVDLLEELAEPEELSGGMGIRAIFAGSFENTADRIISLLSVDAHSCYPPVLDMCCGVRGFWFDKEDDRALFIDNRREIFHLSYPSGNYREVINPDLIADFTKSR